jgi:hypothetical protein
MDGEQNEMMNHTEISRTLSESSVWGLKSPKIQLGCALVKTSMSQRQAKRYILSRVELHMYA